MARFSYKKTLYYGGDLFINQMGNLYHVDVFDADWEAGQDRDPVYHACYATQAEAMQDAESWKAWEDA